MSELHPHESEQAQHGLVCEILADDDQSAQLADFQLFLQAGPYMDVSPEAHAVQRLPARVWESRGSLYQGSYNPNTQESKIACISKTDPSSYEQLIFKPVTDGSTTMLVRWIGSFDMKEIRGLYVFGKVWNNREASLSLRNSTDTPYWLSSRLVDSLMDNNDTPPPIKLELVDRAENAAKRRLRVLLPELTDRPGAVRRTAANIVRVVRRKDTRFIV